MDKGNPVDRLKAWAKLDTMRDDDIRDLRARGFTYAQLTDITGLTRQHLARIVSR